MQSRAKSLLREVVIILVIMGVIVAGVWVIHVIVNVTQNVDGQSSDLESVDLTNVPSPAVSQR